MLHKGIKVGGLALIVGIAAGACNAAPSHTTRATAEATCRTAIKIQLHDPAARIVSGRIGYQAHGAGFILTGDVSSGAAHDMRVLCPTDRSGQATGNLTIA
jgi:hypothetical protein